MEQFSDVIEVQVNVKQFRNDILRGYSKHSLLSSSMGMSTVMVSDWFLGEDFICVAL